MPAGVRPPVQPGYPQPDGISLQFNQQNARGPSVENSNVNDLSNGEQNSLDMKGQETADTENKVKNLLPTIFMIRSHEVLTCELYLGRIQAFKEIKAAF